MEKEEFSKYDKINLGLGILNAIAVIIAIMISVKSINSNENIAEKSGAFDKGELRLSFGGYFVLPDVKYDVYYGLDFSDSSLHFATLPISLHNSGKKTVEDISLLYKYLHIANISVDNLIKFDYPLDDKFERNYSVIEPYDQVFYKTASIHPKFSAHFGDLICLQKETIVKDRFPIEFQDGIVFDVSSTTSYGLPVDVGFMAKDIEANNYSFILNYRNEVNLDILFRKIIDEKISQKDNLIKNFFVIIPEVQDSVGSGNSRIKLMNSNASNTLFCHFNETMDYIYIRKQNGEIKQRIKID